MPATKNHQVVCFGEAMWTVLPTGKQVGGSPVRIACHLQQLGMHPVIVSRIGYDTPGKDMIELLESKNICTDYFQMDEEKLTGVATACMQEGYETIYTIYNDSAWDGIALTGELPALAADSRYFVYDSLAARCSESRHTLMKLLSVARTKVLHLHLCSPFYNRHLVEELLVKADMAILTRAELELITGWFSGYTENDNRLLALQEQCGVPVIGLIDDNDGFTLIVDGTFHRHKSFNRQVKYSGVSSSAFTAGLLASLSSGTGHEEALAYAAATATIGFNNKADLPSYQRKHIDELLFANRL